ncbi:MAG: Ig-like domain-containing protein, partial [Gemmataceae bacterium]
MFRFLKNKLFPNKSKTRLKAYHSIPQLLRLEDRLTPVTGTFAGLPSTLYGPMSVAELNFSSIVTGVDISDFELFKDSTPVSLASAILSGSPSGGSTYRLANLELLTASPGSYTLQLKASATSIIDQASNPLSGQPSLSWTRASSSISASNDNPTTTANTSTTLTPLANDSNSDGSGLRVYSATTINPSQASLTQNPDGSFTFLS